MTTIRSSTSSTVPPAVAPRCWAPAWDVWEVIATVRDNDSRLAAGAEYLGVSVGLIETAVAYHGEYRAEIDAEIALNEAEYERGYAAWEAGRRALEA